MTMIYRDDIILLYSLICQNWKFDKTKIITSYYKLLITSQPIVVDVPIASSDSIKLASNISEV